MPIPIKRAAIRASTMKAAVRNGSEERAIDGVDEPTERRTDHSEMAARCSCARARRALTPAARGSYKLSPIYTSVFARRYTLHAQRQTTLHYVTPQAPLAFSKPRRGCIHSLGRSHASGNGHTCEIWRDPDHPRFSRSPAHLDLPRPPAKNQWEWAGTQWPRGVTAGLLVP